MSAYIRDAHSDQAHAYLRELEDAIFLSALLQFEFVQAVRLQIFRNRRDHTTGLGTQQGKAVLHQFSGDVTSGVFVRRALDWPSMIAKAERLSDRYTSGHGHRTFDILHIATAIAINAETFLTFDQRQAELARAEGLETPL